MPHNTLKLQGGVVVNETPTLNQAGVASCNRIRFRPDIQNLSLPEKLGGWAKFLATQVTVGVVRALWGWQDTASNRWLAWGADVSSSGSSGPVLGAVQCTTNAGTGITTATGSIQLLDPGAIVSASFISLTTAAGSNIVTVTDTKTPAGLSSVYYSCPIAVGGFVLQGVYTPVPDSAVIGSHYNIYATDVLGNPLYAAYSTVNKTITSVTFTSGTPNTLTINYTGAYTVPVNDFVNVVVADGSISGTYQVIASTSTSITVPTNLGSYTFATSGLWGNNGTAPQFYTTSGSTSVTYFLPNHNLSMGDTLYVLNPTLVGGITIQGEYTVKSVLNSAQLTFTAATAATATSQQWQGAVPVTGGTSSGSQVTLNFASLYTPWLPLDFGGITQVYVQGVNPSAWNGTYNFASQTATSVTMTHATAAGSWVSGGSFAAIGGNLLAVYATVNQLGSLTNTVAGTYWTLDNWGNDLIAVPGNSVIFNYPTQPLLYQPIYYWDATGGVTAQPVPNGPTANNGAFVAMPERQIIAWGSTFSGILDPLLVRWCDINNFTTWTAQITNQAGSFRLPSGAAIIGARQIGQQAVLWTDIELWAMQYINQPLVYGFNKIGVGCGLIGKYAHGVLNGVAYWMGKTQIFMLSGNGVAPIPCPIWDVVFQDLDLANVGKITCATNALFQEVAWYFPVKSGSGENSAYIKYNVSSGLWDYGTLDRSAWIDVSVLQQPIGYSPVNQYIYQHEISPDADGAAMGESFTTGWFSLAEGDIMPYVDQVWPDLKWGYYAQSQNANVNFTISGVDYPGQTAQTIGPYTVTQSTTWISPRMRHRLLSFTVAGTGTGTWWRAGAIRYRFQPDGKY